MANINEVFGGNYLKADDLKGRDARVKISGVDVVEFDDGKPKVVLSFEGKDKRLVVNRTNASIIAENTGSSETEDWIGHSVTLSVKKVEFQGKLVPAIRVLLVDAAPPAQAPGKAKAAQDDDSMPF